MDKNSIICKWGNTNYYIYNRKPEMMFNFGLFASHIPYVVFIAVYLLFLLTHSINKLNGKDSLSIPDKNENYIVLNADEFHENSITVYDSQSDDIQIFISPKTQVLTPEGRVLFRFIIPAEDIQYHNLYYSLFSRPPPFIG